ncbi:MAG: peptide chain release factor N(5)-glutamine methyltransferase [Anaerolineae bacterium]
MPVEHNPTIYDTLLAARQRIDPLDAHVLLGEVLGVDRAYLLAHPEAPLTPEQAERFVGLVARCADGEPVAYLLGRRAFYDRDFLVTPDVLIPRPETELLLEQALAWAGDRAIAAADVGTGSGALAVTLAANRPQARVYATDISPAALAVARKNAERSSVGVTFYEGDLLAPLIEHSIRLDLIMANLPYIASDELASLAVSRHEPRLALDGGADGLDLIRRLLAQIPGAINPGALVLLEIGAGQGAAALALVRETLRPQRAELILDYAGLDRIIRAEC